MLTNAVYEDQNEIKNVDDCEDYEELVEGVSQFFSGQNEDRDEVGEDTKYGQDNLGFSQG